MTSNLVVANEAQTLIPSTGQTENPSIVLKFDNTTYKVLSGADLNSSPDHVRFAFLYLILNPARQHIHPLTYLKAAGEALFVTFCLCWMITARSRPLVIKDNPLKARLGYNNLCVGWDEGPANTVAGLLWILVAYLSLRFVVLNHIRYILTTKKQRFQRFGFLANILFGVAVIVFTLCLLISPKQSVWLHTGPFIGFIVTRFFVVLEICLEQWNDIEPKSLQIQVHIFCWIYGVISFVLPCLYVLEYSYYAVHHRKSPFPYQITMLVDYSWFACLALTSIVVPYKWDLSRPINIVIQEQQQKTT